MEKTKIKNLILGLLYDRAEGFFLLDELARAVSVSCEQLRESLDTLKLQGYTLEFTPAHGVRLLKPVRLNSYLIERDLATKRIGRSAICFEEISSTNDVAMDSAKQPDTDGLVVLAESQQQGRGRQGRKWVSPPGANILLSALLLESPQSSLDHDALTIAAGLAVAEGIEKACGLSCSLYWPNDVLLEGKKVAGVLVETRSQGIKKALVIGIGINVNASPSPDQVDFPAADLAERLGHAVERTEIIRSVLRRLDYWVANIATEHLEELHEAWLERCGMLNTRINVLCRGHHYVGRVLDVSPLSGLILSCDDGQQVHLHAESSSIVR